MLDTHSATDRPPTALEGVLRHDRAPLAVLAVLLPLICWGWIVAMAHDMYGPMTGSSAWMMTMHWDGWHLFLLWAMWAVMMAGMMLPSATPTLLLYGAAARRRDGGIRATARIYAMAGGYLAMWALFSVLATVLQRMLAREMASPMASAMLLAIAGVYQLTPLKQACLRTCQSPLGFLMRHWRNGTGGAFRMGLENGAYCLGCCWALMLLLFVGGVMNLWVIAALTVFVAIEKLAPFGPQGARVSGALLIVMAVWMFVR